MGVKELLDEIEQEIDTHDLTSIDRDVVGDATGYTIKLGKWAFVVVEFDIENQGFPPDSKGYDGTAYKKGCVVRLTRELAEKLFKKVQTP